MSHWFARTRVSSRPGVHSPPSRSPSRQPPPTRPSGRWKVRLHAPRTAVKRVRLHLELWAREPPGTTTGEDPNGPPKPSGGRGCKYKLSLGAVQIEAGCLKISG